MERQTKLKNAGTNLRELPKANVVTAVSTKTNTAGIDDNPSQRIKLMFIINVINLLQRRKEKREKEWREGRRKEGSHVGKATAVLYWRIWLIYMQKK